MSKKLNPMVKPVLKWVGGKRQLLDNILPLINENCSTYVEPFLGGGAVFFALQPKKAIINDYNEELINVYEVVKLYPDELIKKLEIHKENNEKYKDVYYYKIRELDRTNQYQQLDMIERAARIIFLNKTCYNGLYRVNSSGHFNSPYGKYKNPNIADPITIKSISEYLNKNNVKILQGDYKLALKGLRKGAFVYFDPPYMPISSSSSFTGYTEGGFNQKKQKELRDECIKLHKKGIRFLQSNSDCEEIRNLYEDSKIFKIINVEASRSINSKANKRGKIGEVLIYNEIE